MTTLASGLSGGEIAGLIVAVFWAVLVCFMAFVLIKLGQVVGETSKLVTGITDQTVPLLGEVTTSVVHVNSELERVDAITANVQTITTNASALSSVFAATLGSPLIKVAAFSYGVRRAMNERREHDLRKRVKAEVKAQRAASKTERTARKAARKAGP